MAVVPTRLDVIVTVPKTERWPPGAAEMMAPPPARTEVGLSFSGVG